MRLDRPRGAPAKTGPRERVEAPERRDHGDLAFLDDIKAGAHPDDHDGRQHRRHAENGTPCVGSAATRSARAGAEQPPQTPVQLAPELFQIGWTVLAVGPAMRALPIAAIAGSPAATPLRVIQRHDGSKPWEVSRSKNTLACSRNAPWKA